MIAPPSWCRTASTDCAPSSRRFGFTLGPALLVVAAVAWWRAALGAAQGGRGHRAAAGHGRVAGPHRACAHLARVDGVRVLAGARFNTGVFHIVLDHGVCPDGYRTSPPLAEPARPKDVSRRGTHRPGAAVLTHNHAARTLRLSARQQEALAAPHRARLRGARNAGGAGLGLGAGAAHLLDLLRRSL